MDDAAAFGRSGAHRAFPTAETRSAMTQGQARGRQDVQQIYCRYSRRVQNIQQSMTVHDVDGAGVTLQPQEEKHVTCPPSVVLRQLPH